MQQYVVKIKISSQASQGIFSMLSHGRERNSEGEMIYWL